MPYLWRSSQQLSLLVRSDCQPSLEQIHLNSTVRQVHALSNGSAGSRTVAKMVERFGINISRYKAGKIMSQLGLVSSQRPKHTYNKSGKEHVVIPNRLNREFNVSQPNKVWCGDVTYIWIGNRGAYITADTGFANAANMEYLHKNTLNAYIPDNQFRSHDPKFADQKIKHGKRHQKPKKDRVKVVIPASEFNFDPVNLTFICPSGEKLSLIGLRDDEYGNPKAFFHGRLLQCRHCKIKEQCMQNPESADHRKGSGRQVSFILNDKRKPNYTDWMKHRVDSDYGKYIYSHRMSVIEPVFANIRTQK